MGDAFTWKGYRMAAILIGAQGSKHRQIHLWPFGTTLSVCTRYEWWRDTVDKSVATGWPDCDLCIHEAFKRIVAA